jgi:hypothetical protein
MNHNEAWDLIPWFVNGRAPADQYARLEQHLTRCPECRAEVAAQRQIMTAMQAPQTLESMPHASLQKLWMRIDGQPAVPALPTPASQRPKLAAWVAAAVAAQVLLLGVLTVVLLSTRGPGGGNDGAFRTVSSPPDAAGSAAVRAVFASEMQVGELQALLERAHLRIVGGPTAEGVLTLGLESPSDDAAHALAVVRTDPAARFAEPIGH